jgi:hypothetical protein
MNTKMGIDRNNYHEVEKWWDEHLLSIMDRMTALVNKSFLETPNWKKALTETEASVLICDLMHAFNMSGKIITTKNQIEIG